MGTDGQVERSLEDMEDGFRRLMIKCGSYKTIRDRWCCDPKVCMVHFIEVGDDRYQRCIVVNEPLCHPRPVILIGIDIFFHLLLAGDDFGLFSRREENTVL